METINEIEASFGTHAGKIVRKGWGLSSTGHSLVSLLRAN